MKLRALHLAAAAAAAATIALQPAPPSHAARNVAVIHLRPTPVRSAQPAIAPALLRAPQEAPLPSLPRPAPTARPLRPLFPWWFRRRHVAAPQPGLA